MTDPLLGIQRRVVMKRLNDAYICAKRCLTDPAYKERFSTWCDRLPGLLRDFDTSHNKILSRLDPVDDVYLFNEEDELRQSFDETYSDILEIKCKVFSLTKGNPNSNDDDGRKPNGKNGNNNSSVKLPRIELKSFDGNYKDFLPFRDLYDQLVHRNEALSKVEKFSYLLSCLKGSALDLIKVFPLSESNYDEAYETLVKRYKNKRHLAFMSWEAILNAKLATNDVTSLRRLLDIFSENLAILKNMDLPTSQWDFILFHTLLIKLDPSTRKEFEMTVTSLEIPSFDTLKDYVIKYCQAWERSSSTVNTLPSTGANTKKNSTGPKKPQFVKGDTRDTSHTTLIASTNNNLCTYCSKDHFIGHCTDFQSLSVQQRFDTAKVKQWCVNCLRPNHSSRTCRSKTSCRHCGRRHHTLLHFPAVSVATSSNANAPPNPPPPPVTNNVSQGPPVNVLTNTINGKTVLLSTAKVDVLDKWGNYQEVRILLDSGSQANFLTDACAQRLGLSKTRSGIPVYGLSNNEVHDLGKVHCTVRPRGASENNLTFDAIVIPKICGEMPSAKIDNSAWTSFKDITFADPLHHIPGAIDALMGAELWPAILRPGSIPATDTTPMALNTIFGWVLMGSVPCETSQKLNACLAITDQPLSTVIQRLWEVENIPDDLPASMEDALCEDMFSKSHCRDDRGRYIVELPMKNDAPEFKGMRSIALRKFYSGEKRRLRNPDLNESYSKFMQDYLESGHMDKVPDTDINRPDAYYIPHHSVINENSVSTRLRVVFNASDPDNNGNSLNKNQYTGPKLQTDISAILLRFRLHNVVMTTDVRQMYRQILVNPKHRHLQRILYRFDSAQPVSEYELNTVTYGVSSSPFLALRVIQQLIEDEGASFPLAAEVLKRDIYIDDIVCGAPTIRDALELQNQLAKIMSKGCFELRKWASNDPNLLRHLPSEHCLSKSQTCDLDQDNFVKVLGLRWDPDHDQFLYKVQPLHRTCSKRTMLSELARIFDPLGFIAPLTLLAKCLIQKLWLLGMDWDEEPSKEVVEIWTKYMDQLPQITKLSVPRQITHSDAVNYQLHGFGDASEVGYGAVVYLRFELPDGTVRVNFVSAKSRVAPTNRWTLPRLELGAAVLVVDLLSYVLKSLAPLLNPQAVYTWTDSMITLAWIQSSPMRWKTFIANRVSHIQRNLPQAIWNYVDTKSNPADCVSRGLLPEQLLEHKLWFNGPDWLLKSQEHWPSVQSISSEVKLLSETEQKTTALVIGTSDDVIKQLLFRFSSLKKIQRVVVYIQRFIKCTRKLPCNVDAITASEMDEALHLLVSRVQHNIFREEFEIIKTGKTLSKPMRKLSPFIDGNSLLRVGGRLVNAPLQYDARHPALLPNNHRLTELIIADVHESNLHPGPQTVQFLLNQRFWVLSSRRAIRRCLNRCYHCFRTNPTPVQPVMAPLPSTRVSGVKAFGKVGCDYAGPFNVIVGKRRRGARSEKIYICIFVCFATKALHIETASDLSSEAFIAALRRFIGRRGRCTHIFSDCGTNFVGAYRQLSALMQTAAESEQIVFSTHPPSAPHFSGLAEAGVKSVKTHLNRVVGSQLLTHEELQTLIIQVEAVLNSRPLCAVSNDPNDLSVLTPGHFITLEPLTTVPEIPESELSLNNRWHHLQRLHRDFWHRWYHDYLNTLMQRAKWSQNKGNLNIGNLVLIKEDNVKPFHWRLGRIINVHPGSDGNIRVATVRTSSGTIKRPAVKLCPLPILTD